MQGGDFENENGTGGRSIQGGKFDDEDSWLPHKEEGLLSMANAGKNTNGSQFFVTFKSTPHLNGKHIVFGRVVGGMDFVKQVEATPTGNNDLPKETVRIVDCGEVEVQERKPSQDIERKTSQDSPAREWVLSEEEQKIVDDQKEKKEELIKKKAQMKEDAAKKLEDIANEEVDEDDPFGLGGVEF